MLKKIQPTDSFRLWMEKINAFVDEYQDIVAFSVDTENSSGLNLYIHGGRINASSEVSEVSSTMVVLDYSATNFVGISIESLPYTIVSGPIADKPSTSYIHLYEVETNATEVISVNDLRTIYSLNNGSGGTDPNLGTVDDFSDTFNSLIA